MAAELMNGNITELSTDKVSLLLQSLVDVRDASKGTQKHLPKEVNELVDNLLDAQKVFVEGIDAFMHRARWKLKEEETVRAIINTCPEVLHTKDRYEYLPIHNVGLSGDQAALLYLPMLAKVGCQHGVGGMGGRGGLLVKNVYGDRPLINCVDNGVDGLEVIKVLMKMEPPLFSKDDVCKNNILHVAIVDDMKALKFYIDLDPSCLFKKDSSRSEPISLLEQFGACVDIQQYLLKRALEYDPQHRSIGTLFATYPSERESRKMRTVLDALFDYDDEDEIWNFIEKEVSPYKDLPILHRIIEYAPNHINEVMKRFPHSLFLRDENNRLPVHLALQKGLKWSTELVAIMNVNMSHLNEKDPVTGYYPFALAAEEPRSDLRTINYLLRMHPGLIESGIDDSKPTGNKFKRRRIE